MEFCMYTDKVGQKMKCLLLFLLTEWSCVYAKTSVTITNDPLPFMVGQNAVLTCFSDTGVVDRIQWVSRDGVVLASDSSVQQLQFMLSPVNDSLSVHTSNFTCSVTRDEGRLNQTISNQTLPVTVIIPSPAISVNISRSGSLVAGSEYNLTCVVSELIAGLTEMPSAVWERFAGVQIPSEAVKESSRTDGMSMAVLQFNPLKTLSNGGYRCRGTLVSPAKQTPLEETAREDIRVQIPALDVVVVLRSFPVDLSFFSGLQLNLTCIIHISPTGLDESTSMAVSAEWSKSGTSLTTNSRVTVDKGPVEVGPLQYQTTLLFESLDTTIDEGNYTCSVHVIHSLEGFLDAVTDTAASLSVTVQTVLFQLKLTGVSNCASWRSIDLVSKDMDMVEELVKFMAANCDCNFSVDRLTDRMFVCHPSSPQSVTYQALLHGTLQAPVADLITLLEEWAFSGVTIQIQHLSLTLDGVCVSFTSSTVECEATEPTKMEDKFSIGVQSVYVIAAVVVVVVVVFVLIITVLIITVVVLNSKLQSKKESKTVGTIPLSYVGTLKDNTLMYEDIESVPSKATPISTSEVDDVKTETCPAYLPLTHQHQPPVAGDTSEQQLYEDVRSYAA